MLLTLDALVVAVTNHVPRSARGSKLAAVALVLREQKNGPEVLVIERARSERDPWSGHLAFPGGKQEQQDATLRQTAERETREEVGLDLDSGASFVGALDGVGARGARIAGLCVAPFVYTAQALPEPTLDPREVQAHFWVPLSPLARGERDTTFTFERDGARYQMPGFEVEGRTLWGMSYQMLRSLLVLADAT